MNSTTNYYGGSPHTSIPEVAETLAAYIHNLPRSQALPPDLISNYLSKQFKITDPRTQQTIISAAYGYPMNSHAA